MGRVTGYAFGGIGLAVEACETVVDARTRADGQLIVRGKVEPSSLSQVKLALERLAIRYELPGLEIQIQSTPAPHCGFGAKTSLLLSALEAASLAADLHICRSELVAVSGRGGASGVGVNSYFSGGMVWDYGHPNAEVPELLPSSLRCPKNLPLHAGGAVFPADWRILLALPTGSHVSAESEANFFKESTPINRTETLDIIASVHHGVIPAVLSARLSDLQIALETIQRTGMKRLEIAKQPNSARLLNELQTLGLACGMSSLGPLVYVVIEEADEDTKQSVIRQCALSNAEYLGCFSSSTGRDISRA